MRLHSGALVFTLGRGHDSAATALRRAERLLWASLAAVLLTFGNVTAALGNHSLPNPPMFWDANNDGVAVASDGDKAYYRVGSSWTTNKIASFSDATAAWRTNTSWDPSVASTTSLPKVWVDGTNQCGGWDGISLAMNCVSFYDRGSYYDISGSIIYVDATPPGGQWEFDPDVQPALGEYSLFGVFTHELGHGVWLDDLYAAVPCANDNTIFTMCGEIDPGPDTWRQRTLANDDINAANAVY